MKLYLFVFGSSFKLCQHINNKRPLFFLILHLAWTNIHSTMETKVAFPDSKESLLQSLDKLPYGARIHHASRLGRDYKDDPRLIKLINDLRTVRFFFKKIVLCHIAPLSTLNNLNTIVLYSSAQRSRVTRDGGGR